MSWVGVGWGVTIVVKVIYRHRDICNVVYMASPAPRRSSLAGKVLSLIKGLACPPSLR